MSREFWHRSKLIMKDGNVHHNEMCSWTLCIGKGWHSFTSSYVNDSCGTSYLEFQDVVQDCESTIGVGQFEEGTK